MKSKIYFYALLTAVGMATTQTRADSLLIVHADVSPPTLELLGLGSFSTIDEFNAGSGNPTLAQLSGYDAVLAYSNFPPADPGGLGDVLADYVDAGGKLTIATYSFSNPWAISGRIATPGYSPLINLGANGDVSGSLDAVDSSDPIFDGVDLGSLSYFHNSNFAHPGLDAGAALLATDGAGINMIARNASGSIIGLNLFPAAGIGNNGELFELVNNSLLGGGNPSTVPDSGSAAVLSGIGLMGVGLVSFLHKKRTAIRS